MLLLSRAKLLVLSNELLLQLYASPIFMLEFASSVTIGSFVFLVFLACLFVCVCVCSNPKGWVENMRFSTPLHSLDPFYDFFLLKIPLSFYISF
jgi:hypothetical protein